jgi:hypothetical protein
MMTGITSVTLLAQEIRNSDGALDAVQPEPTKLPQAMLLLLHLI